MNDYSPDQLLSVCKISSFDGVGFTRLHDCITKILTAVVVARSFDVAKDAEPYLVKRIGEILEEYSKVSIGAALDQLHRVATIGAEFDGGKDGLDALCYHLSGDACKKGISALQSVMLRFSAKD